MIETRDRISNSRGIDRATSRINMIDKANSNINIMQQTPSRSNSPLKLTPIKFNPDLHLSPNLKSPNFMNKFKSEKKSKIKLKLIKGSESAIASFNLKAQKQFMSNRKNRGKYLP